MPQPGHHERMSGDSIRALVAALADVVIEADKPFAVEPLFTRDPRHITDLQILIGMMIIRGVYERHFVAGVVAASMCRDGRVREAAVNALGRAQTPVAAAALAVRVADWVPEVRSAAWAAVSARTGASDAAAIVPVVLALEPRARGREVAASYLAKVAGGPAATVQALAAAGDRACALWALDALKQRSLLTADVLVDRAMHGPDPVIALWCARSLADQSGELPAAVGPRLLASARARVRAFAAGHLSDDQLTRQALQESLLDRSASRAGLPVGFGRRGPAQPDRGSAARSR